MENKIDILISAKDEASKVMKNLGGTIKNSEKAFKNMAVVGGVAFTALSGVIYKSVQSAQESVRVNAQLEAVLKSTGNAVGLTAKQIQEHSSALQKNLGISDEVIASGQNMLLTFTNIGKETFPKATETLLDMATAMNGGLAPSAEALSSQAIQLGKALNDPIQGISALTRVGVTFTEQQKATIQSMVDMGDTAGAQKIILDELAREFGGSALAQAQTFEGSMRKLKVTFDDIFENIGTALIPVIQKLVATITPVLTKISEWASANPDLTAKIILVTGAIVGIIAVIGTLGLALPVIISGFSSLGVVIGALSGPIGWIILAVGALFIAWQNNFLGIQDITKTSMDFMENTVGVGLYNIQESMMTFHNDAMNGNITFLNNLGAWWYDTWQGIKSGFVSISSQIVEAGRTSFTLFKTTVTGIVGEVWDYVRAKLQAIRDMVREIASLGRANTQTFNSGGVSGARADGGPVTGNKTYLVGERGPELFTPASSGNITPNNQLGGVTISINMGGVSVRNDSDINGIARAVADQLTRSLQLAKLGVS